MNDTEIVIEIYFGVHINSLTMDKKKITRLPIIGLKPLLKVGSLQAGPPLGGLHGTAGQLGLSSAQPGPLAGRMDH